MKNIISILEIWRYRSTKDVFFDTLIEVSNNYEESIIHITQSYTFLSGEYFQKYAQYLQGDFSELLDQEYYFKNSYWICF